LVETAVGMSKVVTEAACPAWFRVKGLRIEEFEGLNV
jgi:hypothetical protein